MGKAPKALLPQAQAWVEARKRYHLSHAQVQMARELGLNPRKLGKLASHRQEPWKVPLPQFIEYLYRKRFGRERPQAVTPVEQWARPAAGRKAARDAAAPANVGGSAEGGLT
jgi:hypothetical protein